MRPSRRTERQTDRHTDIPKCITIALLSGNEQLHVVYSTIAAVSAISVPVHCLTQVPHSQLNLEIAAPYYTHNQVSVDGR